MGHVESIKVFEQQGMIRELPDMNRKEFIEFLRKAQEFKNDEYKKLYFHLLKCFTDCDTDYDGRISKDEFDTLIDRAAKLPRQLGIVPSEKELYGGNVNLRKLIRDKHFNSMNVLKNGKISFNEFLSYTRKHIFEKLSSMAESKENSENSTQSDC